LIWRRGAIKIKGHQIMEPDKIRRRGRGARYIALALTFCLIPAALGHAVLLESAPAVHSEVRGDSCAVQLTFNLRVDGKRSRVTLVHPDRTTRAILLDSQPSPSVLRGTVKHLTPGKHRIRWQVLAADGHISRGEVPFVVVAPAAQQ
jgi:methionine-rich copper-binding protein CopC